jgi:hypothetical protein
MFNIWIAIGNKFSLRIIVMERQYEIDRFCVYCFALRVGEFQVYKKKLRSYDENIRTYR